MAQQWVFVFESNLIKNPSRYKKMIEDGNVVVLIRVNDSNIVIADIETIDKITRGLQNGTVE